MIETMKVITAVTFALIFLLIAYKTRTVQPTVKMLLIVVIEFFVTLILLFLTFWMINMGLKKAVITKFDNRRVLATETLYLTGYVQNIGKYTINKAVLDVKILNAVSGKAQKVGMNRDGSKKENTVEKSFIIAKNLRPGEQRKFNAKLKLPPHFNLMDVKKSLSWN